MKYTVKIIVLLFLLSFSCSFSQINKQFFTKANLFFSTYVKNGKVAYSHIKEAPNQLDDLVTLMRDAKVSAKESKEYQAFWINTYNLFVIKTVVDNYPLKSPLDKEGFFDKIEHNVGGIQITLNDMEHKMLQGVFPKEARFHFVLVCAGLGCPPIINNAYLPETLEQQLQEQTEVALNNSDFVKVNKNKVKLSQIFEWYKGDFTQDGKSLLDFVNQYRKDKIQSNMKVSFYPYNWALNQQ